MDGSQFDNLIKRLSTTPLTRAMALRGLAASAAALVGVGISREAGTARKKKTVKRQVCNCRTSDATTCTGVRINREAKRRLLRGNPCAYPGRCVSGKTGCPSVGCQDNTGCTGGQVCQNNICVNCTATNQCGGNQQCVNGRCQSPVGCQNNSGCTEGRVCQNNICVDCTATNQCSGNQQCVNGRCQAPTVQCTPSTTTGCTGANAGLVCNAVGNGCVACTTASNCGSQICIDGLCQGGQTCRQPTAGQPAPCPAPLTCQGTEQLGDEDQCLLTNAQGFGRCTPLDVGGICPAQTQCVLGQCLRPCQRNDDCVPGSQGTCRNGFCVQAI